MIGVVIPYFQRTPGLLNRALRSVAAQRGASATAVYVVDDASPSPPEPELAGLPAAFARQVVVLRQPNGGPGAARNLALDRMDPKIEAVAFLDSDDAWAPLHLQRAQAALDAGADFYFADHKREDDPEPRFAICGYVPDGAAISPATPGLAWCDPRAVFRAIVLRSPVGTSTVAIRRSAIGERRFTTAYRSAGEDSIFWLQTLEQEIRVAASTQCEAAYGRGVSIFNHRSWGDARSLRTTLDEMRSQHYLRAHFRLDPDLVAASLAQCRRHDFSLCANLIACVRRGSWDAAGPAMKYLRLRPLALARLPDALVRALARRPPPASLGSNAAQ